MAVYINQVHGAPAWEALPAAKIIDYPLETRDYRPFAQIQLAMNPERLFVRLTAFEAQPEPESALLFFLRAGSQSFGAAFTSPGGMSTAMGIVEPAAFHRIGGEDLQGVFWGAECAFTMEKLCDALGHFPGPDETLYGNAYKISTGARRHFGRLFDSPPIYSLTEAAALDSRATGPMLLVNY